MLHMVPRSDAPMNTYNYPACWRSATWLNRQADLQLAMGRHVAAERLAERAAELVEAHS